ncbi:MAG TPA: hypothetical protein VL981_01405 [Candidatus Methylacidiphilales bacterium]|nr:hypothetical protein [Candidatus Methylacidiphilales bacterium]
MRLSLPALFFVLSGFVALPAKTINFSGDNFSITIPDTWTTSQAEGRLLLATDANHTAMADLISLPNSDNASVSNPIFIKGIKHGMQVTAQKQGVTMQFSSEGPVTLGGVSAYYLRGAADAPDTGPYYLRCYTWAGNAKLYTLTLQSNDKAADATLQGIAESLAYQSLPAQPGASQLDADKLGYLQSPPAQPDLGVPDAYQFGYRCGRIIGAVIAVLVFFLIIKRLLFRSPPPPPG